MKNTWNINKKEDAVSPVIATILMVAITVVLAAVLYVMVIGFGGDGTSTPAGSWNAAAADSQTSGTLTFGAFTTDVQPLDVKIFVKARCPFFPLEIFLRSNAITGKIFCIDGMAS